MHRRSIVSSMVLVALMAFFPGLVASAAGPVEEGPSHEEGTYELLDCGSFQILDRYELNDTEKWFFDQAGNSLKLLEQVRGTDTFANSVTGKSYTMSYHNTVVVDFSTTPPQGANTGVVFRLTVPGAGAVFLDVGRIVVDRQGNVYFQAHSQHERSGAHETRFVAFHRAVSPARISSYGYTDVCSCSLQLQQHALA